MTKIDHKIIYKKVSAEVQKPNSSFIVQRDEKFALIRGRLFYDVLENFPPHLVQKKTKYPLDTLYTVALHKPTGFLIIANIGANVISRSLLSDRYYITDHVGALIYIPNQGIEIVDVGIVGNLEFSRKVVVRSESACAPSFVFGSQRCNCYDQWLLTQELACQYNEVKLPKLSAKELESWVSAYYRLNDNGIPVPKNHNQSFILIHLASQNGMGSGIIENQFVSDITANAYIRHRGEYSAEQIHKTSLAGGFRAIGIKPDPRKLNNEASYRIPAVILDFLKSPQKVLALTNNKNKLKNLKKAGYKVKQLQVIGRYDKLDALETHDRKREFKHIFKLNRYNSGWKQELKKIIDRIK